MVSGQCTKAHCYGLLGSFHNKELLLCYLSIHAFHLTIHQMSTMTRTDMTKTFECKLLFQRSESPCHLHSFVLNIPQ